jgi:hypothetical protein
MPTELPPSFIRARPPGGDPYGLTGGGYRPSWNEFPYRVNNPLKKQMIRKRDGFDANSSTHRSGMAELGTAMLRPLIREPFTIHLPGELPVSASGQLQ